MNEGFNIIEDAELEKEGLNRCQEISIIQVLKYIREGEIESYGEYCVKGFETLAIRTLDYQKLTESLKDVFSSDLNNLVMSGATFQLEIDTEKANIQKWEKPCIVPKNNNEERYSLFPVFPRIEMENDNPSWYHSQLNINS
jgi:hypothetical protein